MGFFCYCCCLAFCLVLAFAAAAALLADDGLTPCNGSIGECRHEEEGDWQTDSETSRRVLYATGRYIDYDVLRRDLTASSGRPTPFQSYMRGCFRSFYCRS